MVTFLSGGTGTPKLLNGADDAFATDDITVLANTGDDVELGGFFVCPDVDTVLFLGGDELDRETWWGIDSDTATTHEELRTLSEACGFEIGPRYLDDHQQVSGRRLARWRRFSAVGEFMHIGDRDRAVHLMRTSLLDEGKTLTDVTATLARAFDVPWRVCPMSDDPVATLVHTPDGPMHFQEFWVARNGDPTVESVEFRGSDEAAVTDEVRTALDSPVVIGPSNPVTSIGPMLAIEGFEALLTETPVVAVSPFVEDEVFSGPADKLMQATGYEASTRGMADAYPFADAFVLDSEDGTALDRPTVRTDTAMDTERDAHRVASAVDDALSEVTG